ncbi:MAG TPA: thiamine pyrophosphate-binding protein [Steroidobacteraceae bacterium]|nr:thiamine pyrophosphate-binding protein [Steroidobacteraceae bacterium]
MAYDNPDPALSDDPAARPTRRDFLATVVPAAAAVALGTHESHATDAKRTVPSIQIPKDLISSMSAPEHLGSFTEKGGITGAELFAQQCKDENLAALFCAPGNYNVINALAEAGIPCYGGRGEGPMAHAADGFSRVTGEVVACSGTEGPGLTLMVPAIATAHAANTPLLVLASNMNISADDSQSFIQSLNQQALTTGIKKYGKRLTAPNRIHEYGAYAFRHLKSGVPGPVHLDFPSEVAQARFKDPSGLTDYYDKSKYRSESRAIPNPKDVARAVEMIAKAERPLLIAGHGVFYRKAWDPLLRAAEKHEFAVVGSGPMRGHFPDDHRLSASLSPSALLSVDLVVFVGQYLMPTRSDYRLNPDAKAIRVHPVGEELGRNWPLDLGVVGDEAAFLEALADGLPAKKRDTWVAELAGARAKYSSLLDGYHTQALTYARSTGAVHPSIIGHEVHRFFYSGEPGTPDPKQTVASWGGFTCLQFVPPMLRANRPGQGIVSLYQLGMISSEMPHALGAAVAVKRGVGPQAPYKGAPVLAIATDAGIGFCLMELDTAMKYKIPLIVVVYNNNCWGTFIVASDSPRAEHMYLFQENLRYDKAAEALGCRGEYVRTAEELREALKRSYELASRESLPSLINVQGIKEFSMAGKYPPGANILPGPGIGAISH